ncbi:hypothetical protein CH260_24045 [Rhodococcus sp. 05-2256-B2]|nr:hypothetical protein CH257_26180 [Rhodococcus sp. 05-2256-B3]OZD90760.1 hypothetical protein CH260_24045 [Rhodococcus sp. 05-2256-B2]OZD94473.1 hypothetical protein CH258_00265 [Rhodococcus sp. 05-2256-B4]OZE07177.1 hypothetical protein CH285_04925 [Rhodococcus sp. 05-2256-B1]
MAIELICLVTSVEPCRQFIQCALTIDARSNSDKLLTPLRELVTDLIDRQEPASHQRMKNSPVEHICHQQHPLQHIRWNRITPTPYEDPPH